MEATAEELLAVIERMYPREFDRARAELVIVKQQQRISELESAAAQDAPASGG